MFVSSPVREGVMYYALRCGLSRQTIASADDTTPEAFVCDDKQQEGVVFTTNDDGPN